METMQKDVQKQAVLEQLRRARANLLAALEGLSPNDMLRPGVVGLWSIKDVLAHLTVWESELVTALARLDRPSQVPNIVQIEDVDEFNAEQYHVNAPRPLESVLEDFHGVHKHLLRAVEALDERTLTDVRKFRWMEGEPLTYLIADSAHWHEDEHAEQIRAWRTEQGL
ncbi:MAG: DinB family protein [Chloroflexi bacterium CFX4]|nr:DinB family protein [Chloroflexi bacterium CFX4]